MKKHILHLLAIFIVFAFLFQPIAAHASPYPIAISDYSQKPTRQSESFECSTDMDVPQDECEALVAMYEGNNGEGWRFKDNWLITNTVGNWYGITVESGHVVEIFLYMNYLQGSFPTELEDLTYLRKLNLSWNSLTGSIPPEISNFSALQVLNLYNNNLSGALLTEFGEMSN